MEKKPFTDDMEAEFFKFLMLNLQRIRYVKTYIR